jgi:hypothetical protein
MIRAEYRSLSTSYIGPEHVAPFAYFHPESAAPKQDKIIVWTPSCDEAACRGKAAGSFRHLVGAAIPLPKNTIHDPLGTEYLMAVALVSAFEIGELSLMHFADVELARNTEIPS